MVNAPAGSAIIDVRHFSNRLRREAFDLAHDNQFPVTFGHAVDDALDALMEFLSFDLFTNVGEFVMNIDQFLVCDDFIAAQMVDG